VTYGMTHGLAVIANLFVDEETTVWIPTPSWGNYRLIFEGYRGAALRTYPVLEDYRFTLAGIEAIVKEAKRRKAATKEVVVLNFPGNPTGYTPTAAESAEIVRLLASHPGPVVIVTDDAYQNLHYEPGLMPRSLFYELASCSPETHLVAKVDGATKELLFFGGRVAFLTFAADAEASSVLDEKVKGDLRATINVPSVCHRPSCSPALQDARLDDEIHSVLALLGKRYRLLQRLAPTPRRARRPVQQRLLRARARRSRPPKDVRKALLREGIGVVRSTTTARSGSRTAASRTRTSSRWSPASRRTSGRNSARGAVPRPLGLPLRRTCSRARPTCCRPGSESSARSRSVRTARATSPGPKGVLEVQGDGKAAVALDGDARLVAALPDRLFAVHGDVLEWTPRGAAFPGAVGGSMSLPGAVDLLAWCDGDLLVAYADHLELWRVGQEAVRPFGTSLDHIRAVAMGSPCLRLGARADRRRPLVGARDGCAVELARDLKAPRAVASDRLGRAWIVSGEPAALGRLDGSSLVPVASLGDVRDVVFGHTGLYKPHNAYLAEGDGRIEYVHVADLSPP
jgi:aspartate/methionine/tyrosine aminotransferase